MIKFKNKTKNADKLVWNVVTFWGDLASKNMYTRVPVLYTTRIKTQRPWKSLQ